MATDATALPLPPSPYARAPRRRSAAGATAAAATVALLAGLLVAAVATAPAGVMAYTDELWETYPSRCAGMWAHNALPGFSLNSTISLRFLDVSYPANITVLIYNYLDQDLLVNATAERAVTCGEPNTITAGLCTESQRGTYIIRNDTAPVAPIFNEVASFGSSFPTDDSGLSVYKAVYHVDVTGYYCVVVDGLVTVENATYVDTSYTTIFTAFVSYDNPYGELPAADYPKLPFFGLIAATYFIIGCIWFIGAWMSWKDLLQLQHYVTAVIFFLMVEMAFNCGFYAFYNNYGYSSYALLIIVVVLNAA
ncbi:hypothetical protein HK405_000439, partial [Cladochytrium tenue]